MRRASSAAGLFDRRKSDLSVEVVVDARLPYGDVHRPVFQAEAAP